MDSIYPIGTYTLTGPLALLQTLERGKAVPSFLAYLKILPLPNQIPSGLEQQVRIQ